MLWSNKKSYQVEPFEIEDDLESAILETKEVLFGSSRIYLDMKKLIGKKGKTQNIPDGYLIDLTSIKEPKLYLVENELNTHEPLKHIAKQILEFSLSFETTPQVVKSVLKEGLNKDSKARQRCSDYATQNGFENIDYLLERMIYGSNSFNALVIIDQIDNELETVLLSRFKFPVEVLTFQRFIAKDNERIYEFEPFLSEVGVTINTSSKNGKMVTRKAIDPSEIDTVVVPAQKKGFQEVFINQNCWFAIRIHSSMIPKIKYIAAYQVAPKSAITHIAEVKSIERWKDSNKYILNFTKPAREIGPIKLVPKSIIKAPQNSRYTSYDKIKNAKTLDEVF
jgi:hypothetical protein